MNQQQSQHFCKLCNSPTLHTRPDVPFNHVLHLLVSVLLCGLWVPIWLLAAASHRRFPDPWRCTRCGQSPDEMTPDERDANIELVAQERERKREEQAAAVAAFTASVKQAAATTGETVKSAAGVAFPVILRGLRSTPSRVDAAMAFLAGGRENAILHWFLRIVLGSAASVGVVAIVGLVIASAMTPESSTTHPAQPAVNLGDTYAPPAALSWQESSEPDEATFSTPAGQRFLKLHLEELDSFKSKEDFHSYGFGAGGPYSGWLKTVKGKHPGFSQGERIAAGDLLMLGFAYMDSSGNENEKTRFFREEIERVIE